MMVIFVSQCEKKALKRTRRVLDAFADRIGDNTWQTVITEEGLQAVKKLLRQTASKSTAVSCHWIRSRARSDLLWVVGQQNKFDYRGIVPVNYTNQEVIMDKLPIETSAILANTQKQPLSQHLFAVGFWAHQLLTKLDVNHPNLAQAAFIAGFLHDIGKIDPQFQQWLHKKIAKTKEDILPDDGVHIDACVAGYGKFTFEKHPRHNEISWLLAQSLLKNDETLNNSQKNQIVHGVYWHHTRPFRREKMREHFDSARGIHKLFSKSLTGTTFDKVIDQMVAVLADTKKLAQDYQGEDLTQLIPQWDYPFELTSADLPDYKTYDHLSDEIKDITQDISPNALNNLIRMAVISADRMVSRLPADELAEYLADGTLNRLLDNVMLEASSLGQAIESCLQGFPDSERTQAQAQIVQQLADIQEIAECEEKDNIAVLQGPAGCGKTKIALEWAAKTDAQQIFWVCPRVQICLGLVNDLTQAEYLPNSRIEIFTGEYKKIITEGKNFDDVPETAEGDYFSGDIVITTIDQVINNIISHSKVTSMVDFMQAHVVFDEFHELIPMPAFNLLLAELITAKKMRGHRANTLLVSATPNDYFVTKVLGIHQDDMIRMPSFNQADYQLVFSDYNETEVQSPLVTEAISDKDDKTTFVISNTAQDAQLGFLLHQNQENNILLHSKYTKDHKVEYFSGVFESFKQNGSRDYQVLRSAPIVQASLNISCERMFTDLTSPENWLQRLGRLDRFNENAEVNVYTTVLPRSALQGKQSSSAAKFLNRQCIWQSTVAWLHYLQNALQDKGVDTVKLNDLYAIYQAFYEDKNCCEKIQEDLIKALKDSVALINNKLIDPVSIMPKSKRKKDGVVKISRSSLRGANCFVQLAVCEVDEKLQPTFLDEYAYDENTDHSSVTIGLTESKERIQGYDDSERNLLAFMRAKHHNIKEGASKVYKDFILLNEARSPESPIYLSYTPKDLQPIGGERERHPYAMYYVVTDKQTVGTMAINKIASITPSKN